MPRYNKSIMHLQMNTHTKMKSIKKYFTLFGIVLVLVTCYIFQDSFCMDEKCAIFSIFNDNEAYNTFYSDVNEEQKSRHKFVEVEYSTLNFTEATTTDLINLENSEATGTIYFQNVTENIVEDAINCTGITGFSIIEGGNTGNNVWEFMSLYAVSKLYPNKHFVPYISQAMKDKLEEIFEPIDVPVISKSDPKCFNFNNRMKVATQTPIKDIKVTPNRSVMLDIYSFRYKDVMQYGFENIKEVLRFKPQDVEKAMNTLNEIKSRFNFTSVSEPIFVGVHYRGTDYEEYLQKIYFSRFKNANGYSTYKYYIKAMNYFKTKYKNVIFVLISIDYKWLEENRRFFSGNIVVNPNEEGSKVDDYVLLSHCNHTIINYGTFSTSAALFNGGTTIVYDINLPLDGIRGGAIIGLGLTKILKNWVLL